VADPGPVRRGAARVGADRNQEERTVSGPLDDVVVIDLTRALAGPHCGMMLGDLGARVIKVESPDGGDESRGWGPPFVGPEDAPVSTYFLSCNRNKESVALDLKSEHGRDTLARLVTRADVLLENFRPGVLDRLGFPVERLHALNPRLVVLSISGFGHDGPEGGRPGYDQIAQGEAGLMSLTGPDPDHPTRVGVPIGDLLAGMYGAYGVVAALHERNRTGRGRVVRTSLLASIVGVHAFQVTMSVLGKGDLKLDYGVDWKTIHWHCMRAELVPVDSPSDMAKGITRLLGDRALAPRLAAAARERYERHYTMDAVADAMVGLYESCVRSVR
jgi:crotonobetainyl-CoA:carnitine CoA-transferase CaiB-like acyl-CoA transferase